MASTRAVLILCLISTLQTVYGNKREFVADLNKCEQCFGFGGGVRLETPEITGQVSPEEFFKNHVYPTQMPVVMRGLMKDSDAYKNWQMDEYLMSFDVPAESTQRVEINKVQDSNKPIIQMNFHDFVEIYHDLSYYMVDTLPTFMRPDVPVPWCLQCDSMMNDILADLVIWFSSGGTNGYVHTDQVDNLHCVFSGNKYFIMVHPKYLDKIKFDKPVSTSSFIDVNHVGYDVRPELDEVEYYHANISEGDCVYIPFEWIHQVRSFGERHIAISIWWDYYNNTKVDFNKCNKEMDPKLKLSDMKLHPEDHNTHVGTIKDGIVRCVDKALEEGYEGMTLVRFARFSFGELGNDVELLATLIKKSLPSLKRIYAVVDTNGDGLVTREEIDNITDEQWMALRDRWLEMQQFVDSRLGDYTVQKDDWWNPDDDMDAKPMPDVDSIKEEL